MKLDHYLLALILAWAPALPLSAQLLLAGGTLPVCTSMSPNQCAGTPAWSESALDAHQFRITDVALQAWQASLGDDLALPLMAAWQGVLAELAETLPERQSRAELIAGIRQVDPDLLDRTDDRRWWQLLDHLQEPVGARLELVRLDDSTNQSSIEIFRHFVAMATKLSPNRQPRIAVSTASSRDPYDALAFYLQVFEQAGAEVVWLPLDRAVAAARAAGECDRLADFQAALLGSWDRERVYPELFAQQHDFCADAQLGPALIESVDGIFLNGGDQWLTLHAFVDEHGQALPELLRIQEKLKDGRLVLGGTSAGAAVQSGPVMVSNGSIEGALRRGSLEQAPPPPGCQRAQTCPDGLAADTLTFRRGGLGSFAPGIVDTHFSERWRQLRLLQLLSDTGVQIGLGVDETSAVEVSGLFSDEGQVLRALGASGAWLIDLSAAERPSARPRLISGVGLHHLSPDARLDLDIALNDAAYDGAVGGNATMSDCAAASDYASFAELAETALSDQQSSCVRFDFGVEALGRFEPRPLPAVAGNGVRSWRWSLEVLNAD